MVKADWEGGIYEAITEYGLGVKDIDPDADPEFINAVQLLEADLDKIQYCIDYLYDNWKAEGM